MPSIDSVLPEIRARVSVRLRQRALALGVWMVAAHGAALAMPLSAQEPRGVQAWLPDSRGVVASRPLQADAASLLPSPRVRKPGEAPAPIEPVAPEARQPQFGVLLTVYTYVMWVAVPLLLVAYTIMHFANERGRRTKRSLRRLRHRLALSLRREERLRRTVARQQVVVNKLSSIALVDEVAGATEAGAGRNHPTAPRA